MTARQAMQMLKQAVASRWISETAARAKAKYGWRDPLPGESFEDYKKALQDLEDTHKAILFNCQMTDAIDRQIIQEHGIEYFERLHGITREDE